MSMSPDVVVFGAGPAGLTAAYELTRHGVTPRVFERGDRVGGIARTEVYKGYRFDIGGHRFYTKCKEVERMWRDVLGDEFLTRSRLSRIFYNGRFFDYPLSLKNVVGNLGVLESFLIFGSYCKARALPARDEQTFEQWVTNRFGTRLFRTFFKTYTEKVWGIPCSEIRADWAAQRIKGLSFTSAVRNAMFGGNGVKSLIDQFQYPRLGPGQMWEQFQQRVEERGGRVALNHDVLAVRRDGYRVTSATVRHGDRDEQVTADQFVSSMPVSALLRVMDPAPPAEVLHAARSLKYRDFLIVALIIDQAELFPDNWIYVHTPDVRVGRIQNFKNWSPAMVPDASKTCLGMEYFCSRGDDLWAKADGELIELARDEIARLGLANAADVNDGCVIRQLKAYPVYDADYRRHVETIRGFLTRFENLQTIGRNGMHRYNNQDHSMLCGLYAARNVLGATHDLWEVNTERSYYEEHRVPATAADTDGEVLPQPVTSVV